MNMINKFHKPENGKRSQGGSDEQQVRNTRRNGKSRCEALPPDGGAIIRFEGRGIGGVAAHWRAQPGIVRAFQIPRPFAQLSVYENVLAAVLYAAGLCGAGAQRLAAEGLHSPMNPPAISACSTASVWSSPRRSHPAPSFFCSTGLRAGSSSPTSGNLAAAATPAAPAIPALPR